MTTLAAPRADARARRGLLAQMIGAPDGVRGATLLLLLDTLAAVGFAAGLATAIVRVPEGAAAVLPWALLAIASGLARGIAAMLAGRTGAAGARAVKLALRGRIVAALLRAAPGGARSTGALVAAAVDEVEALDGHVARFLPARHAAALGPLIVLVATAIASPVAALILAATLFPFIFALALAGGAAADESRRQFDALSRLSGHLGDRLRALPLILAFRAEAREARRLGAAADEVAGRTLRVLRIAFLSTGALEFFAALSVALVAVYCGFNLLGMLPFPVPETLTLHEAFFVLALAPDFYAPLRRLAAAYHDRQAAETAAERLADLAVAPAAARGDVAAARPPEIVFADVAIRYPGEAADALSGFSLTIAPGETVALVGPSGCGKSSLLHLLLGLAPRSAGTVRIDGRSLGDGASIAESASWAGQAPLIVPGTIAANIALAWPDATRVEIADAVAAAGLDAMLARRDGGLDALLDERGGGLSGGERRRIGLARALLKPAPVLLLDEPTAHLDAEAETAMIGAIRAAVQGRTTLLATHSRTLAGIADRVIDLEQLR